MNETERNLHIMALTKTDHCIPLERTDKLSHVIRELQALRIMKSEPGRMKRIKDNIELLSILWFQS